MNVCGRAGVLNPLAPPFTPPARRRPRAARLRVHARISRRSAWLPRCRGRGRGGPPPRCCSLLLCPRLRVFSHLRSRGNHRERAPHRGLLHLPCAAPGGGSSSRVSSSPSPSRRRRQGGHRLFPCILRFLCPLCNDGGSGRSIAHPLVVCVRLGRSGGRQHCCSSSTPAPDQS